MALLLPIVSRFTLFAGCLLAALFRSGVPSPPPYDRVAAAVLHGSAADAAVTVTVQDTG
jgi:hypothetical protein